MTLRNLLQSSFLRFLLVGGGMAGVYALLAALATSQLPIPRAASSALAWIACIPIAFWAHRRFSFPESRPHRHGLWLYAATQGLSIAIVAAISQLLAQGLFWHDLIVHLFASAVAAVSSYAISRKVIFSDRPDPED